MPTRATAPSDPIDTYNSQGDTVITHDPLNEYRQVAEEIARRQASGLPPAGSAVVQEPAEAPAESLPMTGVARQAAGRELGRLRQQVAGLERELSVPPVGANGMQSPYLVARQQSLRDALRAVQGQIEALESMDDYQVRVWAFDKGYR